MSKGQKRNCVPRCLFWPDAVIGGIFVQREDGARTVFEIETFAAAGTKSGRICGNGAVHAAAEIGLEVLRRFESHDVIVLHIAACHQEGVVIKGLEAGGYHDEFHIVRTQTGGGAEVHLQAEIHGRGGNVPAVGKAKQLHFRKVHRRTENFRLRVAAHLQREAVTDLVGVADGGGLRIVDGAHDSAGQPLPGLSEPSKSTTKRSLTMVSALSMASAAVQDSAR